jgi:putative transcriptional regulator
MRGFTRIPNVKKLREKLGMTQDEFASSYRIPLGTLRDWEQRRKFPDAPARAYLLVIEGNPKGIAALLRKAA